ncbi:MAG: Hsp70 family protein, partial [Desulfobacteraceae bacterium]|nr:Hsp70 family protein [Desulfobacteraceae bacterium]
MDFQDKRYVIGIDLGTTNSAVSYADVQVLKEQAATGKITEKKGMIKVFNVPQLTGHGEFTKIPVLPSFLYIPGEYDISKEVLKHPWKKKEDWFAGIFARDHGSKIPSRLVSSAKSWLCNSNADRQAKILPWGSENMDKVSPVTATAEYLLHIKSAWNAYVKDEDLFLENQFVVVTVPASFNEEARDLTFKAARQAGLHAKVTLLEEPLAAFYSWLIEHEKDWQNHVNPNELILVCDVGGGTTDFSLITLKESEGTPRFERLAVGDHLILGGDNIDLALARIVEAKFKSRSSLSADKWKTLCHRCREAKER